MPHFSAIIATIVYPSNVKNSLALVPFSDLEKKGSRWGLRWEKAFSTTSTARSVVLVKRIVYPVYPPLYCLVLGGICELITAAITYVKESPEPV